MRWFWLPPIKARAPKSTSRQPRSECRSFQLTRRELAKMLGDTMQGCENRVYHKAVIPHGRTDFKRVGGTKSPATGIAPARSERTMPVRENDPYNAEKVRAAIQATLDRIGVAKSSAGKKAGLAERTVGKFLSRRTESMSLANAMRLAHALGITVSELIGEELPKTPARGAAMGEAEIHSLVAHHLRVAAELQQLLTEIRDRD